MHKSAREADLEARVQQLELLLKTAEQRIKKLQSTIEGMKQQERSMAALFRGAQPTAEGRYAHAKLANETSDK